MSLLKTATPETRALDTARPAARRPKRSGGGLTRIATWGVALGAGLLGWTITGRLSTPAFFPSPSTTLDAAVSLWEEGRLWDDITSSAQRIALGWALGLVVGAPLGLLMGRYAIVKRLLDPYIEFFRFIPPIAFLGLAILWFGVGETSKVVLIFYTTVFIVVINTTAGVLAVPETRLRAAAALGAGQVQTLARVIVPSVVPYVVTGARVAMGNSFLTVVSAELIAAQRGLGSLIWTSRSYARTDWVFVGIFCLGALGFVFDRAFRLVTRPLARYGVKS